MDDLIRQIYGGFERFPADMVGVNSNRYQEIRDDVHKAYEDLCSKLPVEHVKELDKLMEANLVLLVVGIEEGFVSGFKHGAKLITEVYQDNE